MPMIRGSPHIVSDDSPRKAYRTMDFDAEVIAGQMLPYQGQLER
jgi:hypothetical protein